jgi:hypothetical protein
MSLSIGLPEPCYGDIGPRTDSGSGGNSKGAKAMGLLSGMFGNATEIDVRGLEYDISGMVVDGETITAAYQVIRDMLVFTNKRLILVDRQGLSGRRTAYVSIPYRDISRFSIETAGSFDLNAELRIWLRGDSVPVVQPFTAGDNIGKVHRMLAQCVLG